MVIRSILEQKHIAPYLIERWLLKQYQKSKTLILAEIYWKTDLKYRQPKEEWVISFRINKQFRAFGFLEKDTLIIYHIDNHQ